MGDDEVEAEPWDWARPLDDDFVRSARVQEDSAHARAARNRRIRTGHERVEPWRAATIRPSAPQRRVDGRRRAIGAKDLFRAVCVLLVLAVAFCTGAVGRVLDGSGVFDGSGGVVVAGNGTPPPPVPQDAADRRLMDLPTVVPGDGGYQLLHRGAVQDAARWDPCRPIHYVTRPDGAPANGDQLVAQAFTELSRATGLVFVSDGATSEKPGLNRPPILKDRYGNRWVPVLVVWSHPAEVGALNGDIAGVAGPYGVDPDGRGVRLVSGTVTLDAPQLAAAQDPTAYISVLLHELGHLVGLDHVEDAADVMYAHGSRHVAYTPGALRGLRKLGEGPCFS